METAGAVGAVGAAKGEGNSGYQDAPVAGATKMLRVVALADTTTELDRADGIGRRGGEKVASR